MAINYEAVALSVSASIIWQMHHMLNTDVSILRMEQGTEVCSMAGGLQAISAYFAPSKDLANHPT